MLCLYFQVVASVFFSLQGCFTIEVTLQCGIETNVTMRLFVLLLPGGFVIMFLVWFFFKISLRKQVKNKVCFFFHFLVNEV